MVKRALLLVLLVLAIQYSALVAWSISAARYWLETGDTCGVVDFADNVAVSLGFSYADAQSIQRAAVRAYCGQ